MLNSFSFGNYVPGNSLLHRLDPRTKIITSFLLIIIVLLFQEARHLLGFGFSVIITALISGISFGTFIRSVRLIFFLIFITMFIHFVFTPGEPYFGIGFITVSKEGFEQGVLISLKLLTIVSVTSLVTLTTTPMALTSGLEELLKPLKKIGLPTDEVALMMGIALRFIPTLWEEAEKIKKAQMSRGALFDSGSLPIRLKNTTSLMVPILVSAFRRADELAMAMESRGYLVGAPRTRLKVLKYKGVDRFVMMSALVIMIFIFIYRFFG